MYWILLLSKDVSEPGLAVHVFSPSRGRWLCRSVTSLVDVEFQASQSYTERQTDRRTGYFVPPWLDFRPSAVCFPALVLRHSFFTVRLGEFPCLLRCDREVALCQPPQPAAESEGADPGDQSSNGRAGDRPLSPGHQSTGGRIGEYLFLFV